MSDNIPNDTASSAIDTIKDSTYRILSAISHGERTTLVDLTDKVVAETKIPISVVSGIMPMIIHEWQAAGEGTINRGRGGGIFPGGKKPRVDTRPRCETCNQVVRTKKEEQ